MITTNTIITRLLLAIVIGGIIGAEREYRNKSAGFRTMILISVGSCLITILSLMIGLPNNPDRIASNIITGIGFIGAGVIFKSDDRVRGLTTAATIWLTAALGMGAGAGFYVVSLLTTIITLLVLISFSLLETKIDSFNQIRTYKIVSPLSTNQLKKFEQLFVHNHLKFKITKKCRINNDLIGVWIVQGKLADHDNLVAHILKDPTVTDFEF